MAQYKLVASDMDETFLHDSCIIPDANKAALARMRELGVLFVPCSGRAYNSIAANLDTLDPKLLDSTYIISLMAASSIATTTLSRYAPVAFPMKQPTRFTVAVANWDFASTCVLTTVLTTSSTHPHPSAISWQVIPRFATKPAKGIRTFPF